MRSAHFSFLIFSICNFLLAPFSATHSTPSINFNFEFLSGIICVLAHSPTFIRVDDHSFPVHFGWLAVSRSLPLPHLLLLLSLSPALSTGVIFIHFPSLFLHPVFVCLRCAVWVSVFIAVRSCQWGHFFRFEMHQHCISITTGAHCALCKRPENSRVSCRPTITEWIAKRRCEL